jgi:citrate lyase subunit beta-like protein
MLNKSRGLNVDCAVYDLEDSVALNQKQSARKALADFLNSSRPKNVNEIGVRINATDTKHALEDLDAIVRPCADVLHLRACADLHCQLRSQNIDTVVVPKVQTAADLTFVTDVIRHRRPSQQPTQQEDAAFRPPLRIIALIETAKGLTNLDEICRATPLTSGLAFAAEDFCLDLSITRTPSLSELLFARSAIVTAARAYDIPSAIDLVTTSFKGEDGMRALRTECESGKRLGFNGKQLIHPNQINVAQREFGPGNEEVEWAVRVLIAGEKAALQNRGAWTLDGKMIDVPVVRKAQAIVDKAVVCQMDIATLKRQWKDQQPQ